MTPNKGLYNTAFNLTVLITGLGYFIDTFDFFLFNSMRVASLTELGLSGDDLTRAGIIILNTQIFGALIGSLIWGMLGDKIGRKKALLGSIFFYSVGMIANAFVHDVLGYALIRFVIGIGVAGELGLGATLVAETMQSSKRTFALTFFTVMGALGVAVAASSIEFVDWRTSCIAGGVLGVLLLLLRSVLFESHLYAKVARTKVRRGSLRDLFGAFRNLKKFVYCVLVLAPNYFVTGMLITLSPEVARATEVQGMIKPNIALALYFTIAAFGDLIGAWLSERFRSRRFVAAAYILGNMILAVGIVQKWHLDVFQFYGMCAAFGFFNLWAISGTIVVEQFPTAMRATASTASLNFSRGTIIISNLLFLFFKPLGVTNVLLMIGTGVFALGLIAVWRLPESYGRSLAD